MSWILSTQFHRPTADLRSNPAVRVFLQVPESLVQAKFPNEHEVVVDDEGNTHVQLARRFFESGSITCVIDVTVRADEFGMTTVRILALPSVARVETYQWRFLEELVPLHEVIANGRVLRIDSEVKSPSRAVFGQDPSGIMMPVYYCNYEPDGLSLVRFLASLPCQSSYIEGPFKGPSPVHLMSRDGQRMRIIGTYPSASSAVALACSMTSINNDVLFVRDAGDTPQHAYVIRKGRVI